MKVHGRKSQYLTEDKQFLIVHNYFGWSIYKLIPNTEQYETTFKYGKTKRDAVAYINNTYYNKQ